MDWSTKLIINWQALIDRQAHGLIDNLMIDCQALINDKIMDWSTKLMMNCQALIDWQAYGLIDKINAWLSSIDWPTSS